MEQRNEQHDTPAAKHPGSCHCGAVRFEVELDLTKGGTMCNCSVCRKLGWVATIVKPNAFTLLSGEGNIAVYEWGGRISKRHFCKTCGVGCFAKGHLEVLGGDYVSVNLNAIDDIDVATLPVMHWDGRHDNWMVGPRDRPWPIHPAAGAPAPSA